jgi:hypothetical protein
VSIVKLSFPGTRRTLAYLFALCGTALFVHLVRSVGAAKILRSIQQIGWGMLAVVAVGGCTFVVRSLAWRCTLGREYRRLPARTLFRVYVAGEAMGLLFFGGLAVADTTPRADASRRRSNDSGDFVGHSRPRAIYRGQCHLSDGDHPVDSARAPRRNRDTTDDLCNRLHLCRDHGFGVDRDA